MIRRIKEVKNWLDQRRHIVLPTAFLLGFIFDYLTLTRIDRLYDNIVLLSYVVLLGASITFLYYYENSFRKNRLFDYLQVLAPTGAQFIFGGLFSAFLVFYSRSASLAASWPFLLILLGLLIGNEFFKKDYARLTFTLSVYYFILFSYFIFLIPVLLGRLGSGIFILSGAMSLVAIAVFVYGLWLIDRREMMAIRRRLTLSVGVIFLAVNGLYFTNIIPPVPLVLKDAGAYYMVERTIDGTYVLDDRDRRWYEIFYSYKRMPIAAGEEIYVFSSVFAPTDLKTNIVHNWQYYNGSLNGWEDETRIEFAVIGGRDGGYRGFSKKASLRSGYWRVDIETPNGLLIGRVKFLVQ